ncbi:MAG: Gfo/Idh/MocA family oxidoreductase [Planctomycetales bacterium]
MSDSGRKQIRQASRRSFLQRAAGAGLAVSAAPLVLPGSVLGLTRPGPNDRINLASIGVGSQGRYDLSRFLPLGDVQVVAVCDAVAKRLAAAKQRIDEHYGNSDCKTYRDFREILDRGDIDAIHTATPDHWHVPIAAASCAANKDVYCQKPLSLTVREARRAVEAARRFGRVFQVGTQNRSNPSTRYACELIRNGRLGKLKTIDVGTWEPSSRCWLPEQPVPDHIDWDMWLGPAPWRPFNAEIQRSRGWMPYMDYSGGGVTDFGAHFFDIVQWAMGTEDTGPVEITPLDPTAEETKNRFVSYRYANGVTVYRTTGNFMRFTGSEGELELDICGWAKIKKVKPVTLDRETIGPNEIHLRKSDNHYENFLECVRSRQRPAADVELGCRAVSICHIGNIAEWLGRPLRWNSLKEEFIDDSEANRWLDRPYREPWSV